MASVTFPIPDDVLAKLESEGFDTGLRLRQAAAFTLCQQGELSTSQAARLAGLTYAGFLEAAAEAKIELFPVTAEEIAEEIAHGFTLGGQRLTGHPPEQNRSG